MFVFFLILLHALYISTVTCTFVTCVIKYQSINVHTGLLGIFLFCLDEIDCQLDMLSGDDDVAYRNHYGVGLALLPVSGVSTWESSSSRSVKRSASSPSRPALQQQSHDERSNAVQFLALNVTVCQWRRDARARQSNDLAERLPPWLSFFLSKEINVYRREHTRNDTVSVNLPTAKICNQSQVSIHVILFHQCLGNKDCN